MALGRNPYIPKAQEAEEKAQSAEDPHTRARAWRDAARLWERAADKERSEKRARAFRERAEQARREADGVAVMPSGMEAEVYRALATDDAQADGVPTASPEMAPPEMGVLPPWALAARDRFAVN
jgi:hypothetical protein